MKNIQSKIYKREDLVFILQKAKSLGKTIGITNGTFDILHAGHVLYLQEAKKICDVLVVSINTDSSVKKYKDVERPFIQEDDRALVVAALDSVDYVTFHSERRMRDTLSFFKPDYYIKGGDYTPEQLESKDILKEWGGKVKIIPLIQGKSTTSVVESIRGVHSMINNQNNKVDDEKKAIILDRDGVINEEVEYLHQPEKFLFIRNALDGIAQMQKIGYEIVVLTTQAGIGLGYFSKEDFFRVNKVMLKGFRQKGIIVSKIYYCPHGVSENCECRKPKIALIKKAEKDLHLNLKKSWMIGDKRADILAGRSAGCRTILVQTGHSGLDREFNVEPDFIVKDLIEAAKIVEDNT